MKFKPIFFTLALVLSLNSIAVAKLSRTGKLTSNVASLTYEYLEGDQEFICPQLRTYPGKRELRIEMLKVEENQRKQGLGKALVLRLLKLALEHQSEIDIISLSAAWGSGPFWQRMGFRSSNSEIITNDRNRSFEMSIGIEEVVNLIERLENHREEIFENINILSPLYRSNRMESTEGFLESNRGFLAILLFLSFLPGIGGFSAL